MTLTNRTIARSVNHVNEKIVENAGQKQRGLWLYSREKDCIDYSHESTLTLNKVSLTERGKYTWPRWFRVDMSIGSLSSQGSFASLLDELVQEEHI